MSNRVRCPHTAVAPPSLKVNYSKSLLSKIHSEEFQKLDPEFSFTSKEKQCNYFLCLAQSLDRSLELETSIFKLFRCQCMSEIFQAPSSRLFDMICVCLHSNTCIFFNKIKGAGGCVGEAVKTKFMWGGHNNFSALSTKSAEIWAKRKITKLGKVIALDFGYLWKGTKTH